MTRAKVNLLRTVMEQITIEVEIENVEEVHHSVLTEKARAAAEKLQPQPKWAQLRIVHQAVLLSHDPAQVHIDHQWL